MQNQHSIVIEPSPTPEPPTGEDSVQEIVRPLMWLDEKLPETHMAPIIPETGEVWEEKQWELVELATDWRYEPDEELRKQALEKYNAAKDGVTFAERPFFQQSTFALGSAFAGVNPPPTYHCNPRTWDRLPEEAKAKFDARVAKEYDWSNASLSHGDGSATPPTL